MAGTVTQSLVRVADNVRLLIFTCTADAAAATFPDTDMDTEHAALVQGWKLVDVLAFLTPGGTAPTDDSDVTVKTKAYPTRTSTISPGTPRDVLGGNGANIIHSASEKAVGTANIANEIVAGNLTLGIANNAVNSATVTIIYKFIKP